MSGGLHERRFMRIIIEGENYENYYAKVHEACRTGLKALFDAKCYGKGYPQYDPEITSFVDIKEVLFQDKEIDLILLTDCWDPRNLREGFRYRDLEKLNCKKAIMLCDFWSEADCRKEEYEQFIIQNDIDYIFSYMRAPLHLYKDLEVYNRIIWYPPCFDPHIFNDWACEKKYDVGNLNAGIYDRTNFYPERYIIHQKLLQMEGITYYHEKHPGTGLLCSETHLIGKSFSEAINQCKIFFTSGNLQYRNFAPKFIEIMASKACLFANEPLDSEIIGLIDGVNYVKVDENNIEDKIRYYLAHEEERCEIAENGYRLAFEKYSCYAQANYIFNQLVNRSKMNKKRREQND